MTIRKPKVGRYGSEYDKAKAAEWVSLYRRAQAEPSGCLCLNPEDAPEDQTWIDGNDPKHLLSMLEDFAELGTFALAGELYAATRLLPLRMEYLAARQQGKSHKQIVEELAEKHHHSTRHIERLVRNDNPGHKMSVT